MADQNVGSSIDGTGGRWSFIWEKMKLDHCFTLYTQTPDT